MSQEIFSVLDKKNTVIIMFFFYNLMQFSPEEKNMSIIMFLSNDKNVMEKI